MKKMPASAFKARCLNVMKHVHATGEPVVVTKRGTPLVKVVPAEQQKKGIFGFMEGELSVVGDIESPLVPLKQWRITRK
jgi:prevent-host-death family protein